jgi:hypothetical protein
MWQPPLKVMVIVTSVMMMVMVIVLITPDYHFYDPCSALASSRDRYDVEIDGGVAKTQEKRWVGCSLTVTKSHLTSANQPQESSAAAC